MHGSYSTSALAGHKESLGKESHSILRPQHHAGFKRTHYIDSGTLKLDIRYIFLPTLVQWPQNIDCRECGDDREIERKLRQMSTWTYSTSDSKTPESRVERLISIRLKISLWIKLIRIRIVVGILTGSPSVEEDSGTLGYVISSVYIVFNGCMRH